MSSYVIAGASKGLGFEFLRQLSADPAAIVIGLARDVEATKKNVAAEIGRSNIHILHGDLIDYESLKKAAEDTSKITGGKLDYLIANGAYVSSYSGFRTFGDMAHEPEVVEEDLLRGYKTNAIGTLHLFNLFLPLIKKGEAKKVVAISTGMADADMAVKYDLAVAGPYAASKAALNMIVAKFSAEYRSEGILFLSISPGLVATDTNNVFLDPSKRSEKEQQRMADMTNVFSKASPTFSGPITPEESIRMVMDVIRTKSVENGDGGSFISHHGTKQWI